jgi:hypothetical protein
VRDITVAINESEFFRLEPRLAPVRGGFIEASRKRCAHGEVSPSGEVIVALARGLSQKIQLRWVVD